MKLQAFDLPIALGKKSNQLRKIGPLIAFTLVLTIIYHPSLSYSIKKFIQTSSWYNQDNDDSITQNGSFKEPCVTTKLCNSSQGQGNILASNLVETKGFVEKLASNNGGETKLIASSSFNMSSDLNKCDIFSGEWVENQEGPYYTNRTCWAIQEHQNCMKYGRPDTGFMKWRWKPDGCDLPVFDPTRFLELVRGKSIAFVGDSVARNHMQSLICLLSKVVYPLDVSVTKDENFKRWTYPNYKFNISIFWSPYLVRTESTNPNDTTRPFKLFLDEFDDDWIAQIESFDYIIISAGHWFMRPTSFYVKRQLVGCLYCSDPNITQLTPYFSYQRAFRTSFKALNGLKNFKGTTFLRTFAPSHFEGGEWDKGGDCKRTRPFTKNETVLEDYSLEFYKIQLEQLRIAQQEGSGKVLKFRLFDATKAIMLRPDGHPSKYFHWPTDGNVTWHNDCVHWCLPGPIDTWNDFLQELLRREAQDASIS